MLEVACLCGFKARGEDRDALLLAMRQHTADQHADLHLSDQNVDDYVDAALRMGAPRPRVDAIESLDVRPLTPERQADFLRFFDYEAFPDNPAWAACYCQFFYVPGRDDWARRSAADNRNGACDQISQRRMTGYLAYVAGAPAGWVNAGPRRLYPRLDMEEQGGQAQDADTVGSIVCFVIAPPFRRHGIARRLLDAALDGFRSQGLTIAEAYPRRDGGRDDAAAFPGPRSLYEAAGFRPHRELEYQTVVRLSLTS